MAGEAAWAASPMSRQRAERQGIPLGSSMALVTRMSSAVAATMPAAGVASSRRSGTSRSRRRAAVPRAISSGGRGSPATRANQ